MNTLIIFAAICYLLSILGVDPIIVKIVAIVGLVCFVLVCAGVHIPACLK